MTAKSDTYGTGTGLTMDYVHWVVSNEILTGQKSYITGQYATRWRRRQWNNIPGWKSLLEAQGYLPTQAYQDEQRECKIVGVTSGVLRFRRKAAPRDGYNIITSVARQPPWDAKTLAGAYDPNLLIDAKNKALQEAKQQRINLSVSVAEGRDTFKMLGNTVRTLGEAYGSFRRGRFKKAAKRLGLDDIPKSFANNWLAYRLGWLPLVQDAQGLIELHRDQYKSERTGRFIVRKMKQDVKTDVVESRDFVLVGNHGLLYRTTVETARAGMLLEITSKLDQFQASVGLSTDDILSTAWELVPFSFVFDYFVDVGTWLGNLSALNGIKVIDAWQIQEKSRTSNLVASASRNSLWDSNHPDRFMVDRIFNRSAWAPGTLTWPRTRSITDQSAIRFTTMAALYYQMFKGDPPIGKFRPKSSE